MSGGPPDKDEEQAPREGAGQPPGERNDGPPAGDGGPSAHAELFETASSR
mgnify:CR=1 FL=1